MKHKIFKPYDKVIVRDVENIWHCDYYSNWDELSNHHRTIGLCYFSDDEILPYSGNTHLVGTTDEPDEVDEEVKLKEGEWIFASTQSYKIDEDWCFGKFRGISPSDSSIILKGLPWKYCIRLVDFNPYDMEETKKHILCVKNGKLIYYNIEPKLDKSEGIIVTGY